VFAQVFLAGSTIVALAAHMTQPRDAYAVAHTESIYPCSDRLYGTDDFMTWNDGQDGLGKLAVHDV